MMTLGLSHARGFTMVELVVALIISAMIVGSVSMLMIAPVDAHFAQQRRTELVDDSGTLARQMREDLTHALPNSVRILNIGQSSIVELLLVTDSVLYYPFGAPGAMNDRQLDLYNTQADSEFAVFPHLKGPALPRTINGSYIAIGNTGGVWDAYKPANEVITGQSFDVTPTGDVDKLKLKTAQFWFKNQPAGNRLFIVSTPVTYICNSAVGVEKLQRYANYPISANIPASASAPQLAGSSVALILSDVASCRFQCSLVSATDRCGRGLTVDMSVRRRAEIGAESIRVFSTIPLDNRP
jgi:prepilin-type N-terminal cleavage/methylation domain-containing protein